MTVDPRYVRIHEGDPLPDLSGHAPFRAAIVIEARCSPEWQKNVSEWLVHGGCLYMMAWGANCSSWDDSVDFANLDQFEFEAIPEESFVMTTWHEKDSLEEVFRYAGHCAQHPVVDLKTTLIVHVCSQNDEARMLHRFTNAQQIH